MIEYYSFEFLQNIFKGYNNFINNLQETSKSGDPHLGLEPNDPMEKITDRQIIESGIAFNQSCLSKEEQ